MKLVGRIQVEPLDDERLTNIERRIVAGATEAAARPVRESRAGLAFAVAAVVVLGAGVAGWQLRGASGAAPVVAEATPLEVRTGAQRTSLDLGDATITSDPSTVFTVTRPDGGVLVTMTRGKVELEVAKRAGRAPLIVRAGETDVVVVGTRFSVDYGDGEHGVDVRVTEGVVRVVHLRKEVRLAAGEAWTSRRGVVAIAEPSAVAANGGAQGGNGGANEIANGGANEIADGGANEIANGPGESMGDRNRSAGEDIEIEMGRAPDVLHERVASVPDARVPSPHSGGSETRPARAAGTERRPRGREPRGGLRARIRSYPVFPALEVEPGTQPIREYGEIMVQDKGPKEAYAFYSMAVVQYEQGNTAAAERTLTTYIDRRAPTSEHYTAALWLRIRLRCLRALDARCREAADAYVRRGATDAAGAGIAKAIIASIPSP